MRAGSASREEPPGGFLAVHPLEFGELRLAVHPERFPDGRGLDRAHRNAFADRSRDHVGQVVLALRVVVAERPEPAREVARREDHDAGAHLAQRALGRGGVLLLHDALHRAAFAHDAAIAGRVVERHGDERDAVAGGSR